MNLHHIFKSYLSHFGENTSYNFTINLDFCWKPVDENSESNVFFITYLLFHDGMNRIKIFKQKCIWLKSFALQNKTHCTSKEVQFFKACTQDFSKVKCCINVTCIIVSNPNKASSQCYSILTETFLHQQRTNIELTDTEDVDGTIPWKRPPQPFPQFLGWIEERQRKTELYVIMVMDGLDFDIRILGEVHPPAKCHSGICVCVTLLTHSGSKVSTYDESVWQWQGMTHLGEKKY